MKFCFAIVKLSQSFYVQVNRKVGSYSCLLFGNKGKIILTVYLFCDNSFSDTADNYHSFKNEKAIILKCTVITTIIPCIKTAN